MKFLINCSNLKVGGGIQVADSICSLLNMLDNHSFLVVLSSKMDETANRIKKYNNVEVKRYDIRNSISTLLVGRDYYLDSLVDKEKINAVLTVFGPSRWNPRCAHLCGFARPQLVLRDSPFYKTFSIIERLKLKVLAYFFRRCSKVFWTENPMITKLVRPYLGKSRVYTVTNYYNQVFDNPNDWINKNLVPFNGITILTVSSYNLHKNFPIMADVCHYMRKFHPGFSFRFVLTLQREQCTFVTDEIEKNFLFIGKVDVSQCPSLYQQSDIMFMPTLMECFTATYPEAMRMEVPIVTTDLEFAHGLCGDAACYYDATNAEAAAEAIYKVATNKEYAKRLTEAGTKQLKKFDDYNKRAEKLISILEEIAQE